MSTAALTFNPVGQVFKFLCTIYNKNMLLEKKKKKIMKLTAFCRK
jgi:hypothetical protein